MMHLRKIAVLRTQLRDVNIEYSALVRADGEGRLVRMDELGRQRRALMALIAKARRRPRHETPRAFVSQPPLAAAVEQAA
jgi:hypothetical protein